jgi:hypothetical protein
LRLSVDGVVIGNSAPSEQSGSVGIINRSHHRGIEAVEHIVHTAAEYREMAEECFQWAETASNEEVRANYLGSALIWLQAAARLDGGLPVRGRVIPKHSNGKWNEPRAKL